LEVTAEPMGDHCIPKGQPRRIPGSAFRTDCWDKR